MSAQAMADFLVEANQNEALAVGMVEAIGDKEGAAATSAVAEYANQNGYDVTEEDAAEAQMALVKATEGEGELSDDDLDDVSGGIAGTIALAAAATSIAASGAITGANMAASGGIVSSVIGHGINKTVNDVGEFFKQW
ncbi:hypothetical protein [Thalassospira tepidiphila]|jgi:hypothetical protein|uniref:hypothetical protein n=1 Tax=Thalassospira tepidiphila TaxID=393657 RepID=UPI001BCEC48E|nr:hypothetical protein [Thalassospira tepidiphila]